MKKFLLAGICLTLVSACATLVDSSRFGSPVSKIEVLKALAVARQNEVVNLSKKNLADLDLSFLNFKAADLSQSFLKNTNFEHSNLQSVNLEGANLQNTNFIGVTLSNANMKGARQG